MNPANELATLQIELGSLDNLLKLAGDGSVEHLSFQKRKRQVQSEMEQFYHRSGLASLTFQGDPVDASKSIAADFGGKAVELFSMAVATMGVNLKQNISSSGRIPGFRDFVPRVAGVAHGSFGFLIEPSQPVGQLELDSTKISPIEAALIVLNMAKGGEEEELARLIQNSPRSGKALKEFVSHVAENHATFRLAFGGKTTQINSPEEGKAIVELLSAEPAEEILNVNLRLTGVLPRSQKFEGLMGDEPIQGTISDNLDAETLKRDFVDRGEHPAQLTLVTFHGRRYYTLTAITPAKSSAQ